MVPLGFDGISVYRDSILAEFTLGRVRNRLRVDNFVFSPDVSRLLVRGKAHRAGYWTDIRHHLEILCRIGGGWLWDCSDHRDHAAFHDGRRGTECSGEDGFSFAGIHRSVY